MGVVRKEDGTLHFFVNGVAQGPAAWNVPPNIYAVADLYGQAAQATIVDDTGSGPGQTQDGSVAGKGAGAGHSLGHSLLTDPAGLILKPRRSGRSETDLQPARKRKKLKKQEDTLIQKRGGHIQMARDVVEQGTHAAGFSLEYLSAQPASLLAGPGSRALAFGPGSEMRVSLLSASRRVAFGGRGGL